MSGAADAQGSASGENDRLSARQESPLPEPPSLPRQIRLTRKQLLGLPLIVLVPLLTLLGVFGEHQGTVGVEHGPFSVVVRYPDRFRYRQVQQLDISLVNLSQRAIDTVRVSLDTAYISRFSSVRIIPTPRSAFVVELSGVGPGERRLVTAELWGERYGVHRGRIVVSAGTDSASVELRTLVFP
ncbi:MAG: hypothetical protein ACJ796_08050 [Gemmatimonadaceae bacterium]